MQQKSLDGITKRKISHAEPFFIVPLLTPRSPWSLKKVVFPASALRRNFLIPFVLFMVVSFAGGMFTVLESHSTRASSQVLAASTTAVAGPHPTDLDLQGFAQEKISSFIESWEHDVATKRYQERKEKLRAYLASKGSPFAKEDDTLDAFLQSPYTGLMLGIANAESTLGRNCFENNCSGIGGSDLYSYPSHAAWVKSLSNLLERRYKNWTIEQMDGVYVKPGGEHWTSAVYQVQEELRAAGVE